MNNNQINKIFNSIDNKHEIELKIISEIVWFNINKSDFEYYKTFLILLKDVLIYLSKNNIKYIKQYIFEEDLNYFTKSSFIQSNDNEYVVSTNIVDFLSEIINVLGIKKI
jgi:hypothetical protein